MQRVLEQTCSAISVCDESDPINDCPASVLALLPAHPDPLIALAHLKLHTFPFASVPTCWRRLYTDASIAKAVALIEQGIVHSKDYATSPSRSKRKRGGDQDQSPDDGVTGDAWVDEAVKVLDMAAIMAGAAGREEMIEALLSELQSYLVHAAPSQKKRLRVDRGWDSFPVARNMELSDVPHIQYPIQSAAAPSMQAFEMHMKTAQPLRIKDVLAHWPAMHERPWSSPAYLLDRTLGGRRLIPVEIGRSYTDVNWGQSIITFRKFMERYMMSQITDPGKLGYLAQHDLFSQIPSLRNDIAIPDYCYTESPPLKTSSSAASEKPSNRLDEPMLNAWFGPAGTVSPLHTDPYHNIFCQVVGKKYIRLYSPDQTSKLYPRGVEDGGVDMSNTSEVDAEGAQNELEAHYPLFRQTEYLETILSEGECLYIPVGWWHYVRSLSVSFSVSFWWS
ncbi:MAG: hypothetical protein Q9192_002919 [Flavoplaca navasiana]